MRQHHGPGELFEIEAQSRFEQGLVFGFVLGAENLFAVQIGQGLAAGLEFFRRIIARAVGFPASTVAALVDADEIHFGIAAAGAATQQVARVVGADVAVDLRHSGLADIVQPRDRAEQCKAQGIKQRALARAGGAGDREQPGTGQGFCGEIQLEGTCQRSEVFQANGENLHGCSPSSCTS